MSLMRPKALIVEDEPHIAEALEFLFQREGIETTILADGGAALSQLDGYDVVVLDIMLPGASGFDIAAEALKRPAPPKVCVLTAKGQAADQERMKAIGVDAFVTKPFSNKALMDVVRHLLAEV
ncbi:MAG: response regulator transcription factor [Pseudomonadota bacterium]